MKMLLFGLCCKNAHSRNKKDLEGRHGIKPEEHKLFQMYTYY